MAKRPYDKLTAEEQQRVTAAATELMGRTRERNEEYSSRTGEPSTVTDYDYAAGIRELEDIAAKIVIATRL